MEAKPFTGRDELVAGLDAAVQMSSVEQITSSVQGLLVDLIQRRVLSLPEPMTRQSESGYARHLVHKSDAFGYAVVAMVWGPGQGTALHDHSGSWCVEGVVTGEIEVTQYELLSHQGERFRFQMHDTLRSFTGSAGSLIPPFEYHTIANPRGEATSITLHVYGEELKQCSIFESTGDDWYLHRSRELRYDD